MEFSALREAAQAQVSDETWAYFDGTADSDPDRDARAWQQWDLIPRVLTGLTSIDTSSTLQGSRMACPIIVAPSASQGALHPDGELATRRAAAATGLIAAYSYHATVPVDDFARAADAPWWAQAYVMTNRSISDDYLRRCADLGAHAVVVTVDVPGDLADAQFRRRALSSPVAQRGNYPRDTAGRPISVTTESNLRPDEIARTADVCGLPIWVKGIMTASDARTALEAGAAGVFVSNHARRQLAGVAPTASVLREIVQGVDGIAPVAVDGGIRSGTDVVRALALGASAVAVGRPAIWALAAGGQPALEAVLNALTDEVRVAMAGLGAARISDLVPTMVRRTEF